MSQSTKINTPYDWEVSDVLWVDSNDNVSIGAIDNPTARLQITGSAKFGAASTYSLDVNEIFFVSGSTAKPRAGVGPFTSTMGVDAVLHVTGSEINVPILNVGNFVHISGSTANPRVGIGTSHPDGPLHVSGSNIIISTQASGSGAANMGTICWQVINGAAYLYLCTGSSAWVVFSGSRLS